MKWIGLTGGIASGKSEVSRILVELGVPVVDADRLAHLALKKGQAPYQKVVDHFGKSILTSDGEIDRKKLGAKVFPEPKERLHLESLIHPFVQTKVRERREELAQQGHPWAVYDVPLLFEKGLQAQFDRIVLVYCKPEQQIERLMKRNGLQADEADARLQSQWPVDKKAINADDVIDNTGALEDLHKNVLAWKMSIDAKYNSLAT